MKAKTTERMISALENGWGFQDLNISKNRSERHSLWTENPIEGGWKCHKIDGCSEDTDDILSLLMDEAGIP